MKNFFLLNKNLFFLISFVTMLGSIWVYVDFKNVIKKHEEEIQRIEVNRAYKTAKTILLQLDAYTSSDILKIKYDPILSSDIGILLSHYRNDEFKYVYVVYIDKKGAYRHLADGSEVNERAFLNQKFAPSKTLLWDKLLKEKKAVYDIQDSAEGLWLTYLTPILKNSEIEAILVLDVSTQEFNNFSKLITPLNNSLNVFFTVIFAVFIAIILQGIIFYSEFKKSMIDPLTKLYNRKYMEEISLKTNLEKTSIMMVDVDHFKSINDDYGHDVGDLVLTSIARKLVGATRLEDKVIRYGGEEFLILIKSAKSKNDVICIAQRIKDNISKESIRIDEKLSISATASIGLNLCENSSKSFYQEVKNADKMLYTAKRNGRNRIEIYKD